MGSQHVGVFYDGIQLGNAQNGQIDLGRFSLDNMEAVSVYNGQKSSFLQTAKDYASAGTIYMRTRKPRFEDNKRTTGRRFQDRIVRHGQSIRSVGAPFSATG